MKTKRFLAALLCLLMLVSLFPASALADDGPDPTGLVDAAGETGTGTDEEPANEAEEEPADDPVDDPADDPADANDDPAEDPAEDPEDDPAEEPAEDPAEEPAEGSAAEPAPEGITEDGGEAAEAIGAADTAKAAAAPAGGDASGAFDSAASDEVAAAYSSETDKNTEADEAGSDAEEPSYPAFDRSRTVNGVTVCLSAPEGVFPEGAELSVTAVPSARVEAAVAAERDENANVAVSYTFDIKVMLDGGELQPADEALVKVSFALAQANDTNLDATIYHISDGEASALDTTGASGQVSAETDGFSLYTVEFTYNTLEYVLSGGGSVKLETILSAVGLTGEAEAASVSDASLFSVSNETGEWIVTSHRAFTTTEWLRVTIAGVEYEITVTDDPGAVPYVDASGAAQTPVTEYTAVTASTTTWTTGWYVVDANTTISTRIEITGAVNLILCNGATLTASKGIHLTGTNSLTIWAQSTYATMGKLTTGTPDDSQAGIGGNNNQNGGTVTVNGGTVTAQGGKWAAGIGGGEAGAGSSITINGGKVTASSTIDGAGIGGGGWGETGTVTITGGSVTADGGGRAAGIGSGCGGYGGSILITGGTVKATGAEAGIGGGLGADGADVTITGGTVTAKSGSDDNQQAIGHGGDYNGTYTLKSGALTITGMRVTSPAGTLAAGREDACRATGTVTLAVCRAHEAGEDGLCKWCGRLLGSGRETDPYLIPGEAAWNALAALAVTAEATSGLYFKQTADISVTKEIPVFAGTYDGGGHTLTVAISGEGSAAPFHSVSGAAVRHLAVTGTVSGGMHCAGLVGGVIGGRNVISDCVIDVSVTGSGTHCGGVVGHAGSYEMNIMSCVFTGGISGAGTAGTFWGWSDSGASGGLAYCLDLSESVHPVGRGAGSLATVNTYYTRSGKISDGSRAWSSANQGKLAYPVTAVSGIDPGFQQTLDLDSVAAGLTGSIPGLMRGDTIYAAEGENLKLVLSVPGASDVSFSASAGTLTETADGFTFTMPASAVTISANAPIPYVDAQGNDMGTQSCQLLYPTADTWATGWYVVNTDMQIDTRITVTGDVKLILTDGCTLNAVKGVNVSGGNSLTIYGQSGGGGTLTAFGDGGAGIGGNTYAGCGSITINGGTINASVDGTTSGSRGAAIGGGRSRDNGVITINGGIVTARANGTSSAIGGGGAWNAGNPAGAGGTILITGGTVTASATYGAAIGGGGATTVNTNGGAPGSITITGGTVTASTRDSAAIGSGRGNTVAGGTITITGGTVTADCINSSSQAIGHGKDSDDSVSLCIDGMKVYASEDAADPVPPAERMDTCRSGWVKLTACDSHIDSSGNGLCDLCGALCGPVSYLDPTDEDEGVGTCSSYTVITDQTALSDGWYVAAPGTVTISDRITVTGNVNIILSDGATLTAAKGITVEEGNSLTVWCQSGQTGTLFAGTTDGTDTTCTEFYAGIGSATARAGAITINGGQIIARGGSTRGAGIGGNQYHPCSLITINGGTVTATGHQWAAGIGNGPDNTAADGGSVVINGGTVTATATYRAAGLGGGMNGTAPDVTITGGAVTATGSSSNGSCPGIGGGINRTSGAVTITGGTVTAIPGSGAQAIGSAAGYSGTPGPLIIDGMKVTDPADTLSDGREDACRASAAVTLEVCGPHSYDHGKCTLCGAEDPDYVTYPLWVSGVQVTSLNKGDVLGDGSGVTYDPDSQTLTFPENITLTGAHSDAVIYANNQDLTVHAPNGLTLNNSDVMYGILVTGSGKALTVETGGVLAITVKSNGISARSGGVTVTGNVNITVGKQGILTNGPVTVNGGVTIRSGGIYGINADGNVELSGNIDIETNGYCILTFGDIALDYGTCTLTNNGSSYNAISGNIITLEGNSFTAVTRANDFDCVMARQKLTLVRGDFSFTGGNIAIQSNGDIEIQSGVTRVYGKCTSTRYSVICAYNNGEIKLADNLRIVTPEDGYIDNTNYSKIVDKDGNTVSEVVIELISYPLWVGGVQMTDANKGDILGDGTASFDPDSNTLTLTNANITATSSNQASGGFTYNYVVYAYGLALTVSLSGDNTVGDGSADYAIMSDQGTLAITGGGLTAAGSVSALYAENGISITGSTVIAEGGTSYSDGIFTDRAVTITDSTVTATGSRYGICAIKGAITISGADSVVTASGGRMALRTTNGGGVTLNDGLAYIEGEATAKKAVIAKAYAVTVVGGTADVSEAKAGVPVTITANTPEPGYVFGRWSGEGVDFADAFAAETTFTMPAKDVTVTAAFAPAPLTGAVSISGTAVYGNTLAAVYTPGNNTGVISYQWLRDGAEIAGAASDTYTLAGDDVGRRIACAVSSTVQTGAVASDPVTVAQAALTITALPQTYTYNGQIQGEGDTAYEDPAEIAERVSVDGLQYDDRLASITLDGQGANADGYGLAVNGAVVRNAAGDDVTSNYDITFVPGTLTIEPAKLTITAEAKSKTYGEADPALTYTADGLVAGDAIAGELTRAAGENVGTYAITQGTLTAGDNYTMTFTGASLTITKADITPAVSLDGWTYGETSKTPSVTGNTGNGKVTYTYAAKEDGTYSETVPTDAGIYYVKAAVAESDNYNAAATAPASFTIAKADPDYTAPTGLTAVYDDTLAVVTLPDGWAWADDTQSVGNAGTNTFKAIFTPTDTANYNTVEDIDVSVTVTKADITPAVSLDGWTYGETSKTPSVTGNTGNGKVTYTYAAKGDSDFSATVPTNAGDYTVKATIAGTDNYNGGEATADFTIAKAEITITADDKSSKYGEDIAELTYQVGGAYKDGDDLDVTVNTTATKTSDVGEYPITVSWNENPNYTATLTNGKYTVTKTALPVSASGYSGAYDGKAHGITVEVDTSGATVYYAETELTADNYTAAGSTKEITRTDVGTTTVYYYVEGRNYDAVSGSKTIEIAKADPDYTVPTGLTAVYGDTLADVILPDGWAWAGSTASIGNAGTNTFKAIFTPTDTANYNTVENVDVTVTVAKADITPAVTIEGWAANEDAKTPSVTGNTGNGAVTYTYAAKGSSDFTAAVPATAGDYTVKATIAETDYYNGSEATADFTIQAVYTVRFSTNGGTEIQEQTVPVGEKAARPADPEKAGNEFTGWYKDATFAVAFDFDTPITADVTIYAKWTPTDYQLTSITGTTTDISHTWTKGSDVDVVITVKLNAEPDVSYAHFTGVEIDGTALVRDTDYTASEGSTVVTLKAAAMEKLSVGAHTVTILFDNGKVDTRLTVKEAAAKPNTTNKPEAAKPTTPRTGDENSAELWIAVLALCGFGLSGVVITNKKRRAGSKH